MKLLVVDDYLHLRRLIGIYLRDAGHQVTEAGTGIDGYSETMGVYDGGEAQYVHVPLIGGDAEKNAEDVEELDGRCAERNEAVQLVHAPDRIDHLLRDDGVGTAHVACIDAREEGRTRPRA